MEYRDFTKKLDTTVHEKGRQHEVEHYEWFHNQGVWLKTKYRIRPGRRGGN